MSLADARLSIHQTLAPGLKGCIGVDKTPLGGRELHGQCFRIAVVELSDEQKNKIVDWVRCGGRGGGGGGEMNEREMGR